MRPARNFHKGRLYYALTKPTRDFSPEHLVSMAESGCKYLLWGLESGNQRVLDLMDKGSKIEDVSWVLKRAYAAGINNHTFMIKTICIPATSRAGSEPTRAGPYLATIKEVDGETLSPFG